MLVTANSKTFGFAQDGKFNKDAFGFERVSMTGQRFDIEFTMDDQPLLMHKDTIGASTIEYNTTYRDVRLSINSTTNGDTADFHQDFDNPYTPGNGQLIEITGVPDLSGVNDLTAEVFLKRGNGMSEIVKPVHLPYAADWSKSHIFVMDFQSLKVGRIRFNLNHNGASYQCAEINNDNLNDSGYWQYPALPVRWAIYNTATETITEISYSDDANGIGFRFRQPLNASAVAVAICATVKSEGGPSLFDLPGFSFGAPDILQYPIIAATSKTVSTTVVPIISIRRASIFKTLPNKTLVIPKQFNVQTDNPIVVQLILNGTLGGVPNWQPVNTESAVEFDVDATTITGGDPVNMALYVSTGAKNSTSGKEGFLGKSVIGSQDNEDILTLVALRTSTTDAEVFAGIEWEEIR